MPQRPSIAIIGAGPAGLTAANIFRNHGWDFTIFEADASATSREQGGSLDLHPLEGQLALEKAGLLALFMANARHEGQEQRIADHKTGALLHHELPEPGISERPEIDRLVLRELLLTPLDENSIRWNTRLEKVSARPDGKYELYTTSGVAGLFDLVVGADGAGSKVRAALTDVRPIYTGITFVELILNNVDDCHPDEAERVGHGSLFALHDNKGIIAQRNGNDIIRVYAAFRTLPEETDRPDKTLSGLSTGELLARFEGWSPLLLSLIAKAERVVAVRPIVTLPAAHRWPQQDGLTLIGDAAHVMPPLGVGVNLAMLDAAELAEALTNGADWQQAVRQSEDVMLKRSGVISAQCVSALQYMFSAEGSQAALNNMGINQQTSID